MNLNSIIFPAPKSSYTIETLLDELIWIPKYHKETKGSPQNMHSFSKFPQEPSILTMHSNDFHQIKQKSPDVGLKRTGSMDFDSEGDSTVLFPTLLSSPHHILKARSVHIPPLRAVKTNSKEPYARFEHSQLIESKKLSPLYDNFDDVNVNVVDTDAEANASVPNELTEENFGNINEFEEVEKFSRNNNFNSLDICIRPLPLKPMTSRNNLSNCNKGGRNTAAINFGLRYSQSSTMRNSCDQWDFSSPTLTAKRDAKTFSTPVWHFDKTFDHNRSESEYKIELHQMRPLYGPDALDPRKKQATHSHVETTFGDLSRQRHIPELIKPQDMQKYNQNLNRPSRASSETAVESYIPCLLLQSEIPSDKILIYFHGNGEDINLAYDLSAQLRDHLNINILAVEYPGYGLYKGVTEEETIIKDAEAVYDYLNNKLNIEHQNILVCGRSIGSGPATYLSSQREVGALILISAFTSIRAVVKDFAGSWAQYLIKQRFNNIEAIAKVTSPTFIVHGQKDLLIPYSHSQQLHSLCKAASELLLPKDMDHTEFDFDELTSHLKHFLKRCGIKLGWSSKEIYFPKLLFKVPDTVQKSKKRSKNIRDETQKKFSLSKSLIESASPPMH